MLPPQQEDGLEGDVRSLLRHPIDPKAQNEGERPTMNPQTVEEMTKDLAITLRDILNETDDSYIEREPEDAFVDLAARLVLRLSKNQITIVPTIQAARNAAARRIFDIFSTWLQMQPGLAYVTRLNEATGKVEVTTLGSNGIQAFFQGSDVQDACAQMTQVIMLNGGQL